MTILTEANRQERCVTSVKNHIGSELFFFFLQLPLNEQTRPFFEHLSVST